MIEHELPTFQSWAERSSGLAFLKSNIFDIFNIFFKSQARLDALSELFPILKRRQYRIHYSDNEWSFFSNVGHSNNYSLNGLDRPDNY